MRPCAVIALTCTNCTMPVSACSLEVWLTSHLFTFLTLKFCMPTNITFDRMKQGKAGREGSERQTHVQSASLMTVSRSTSSSSGNVRHICFAFPLLPLFLACLRA